MLLHSLYCYQESSHTADTLLLSRVHHVGSIADCARKPGARSSVYYRALPRTVDGGSPGARGHTCKYIYIYTYATRDHILHDYWPRCARQLLSYVRRGLCDPFFFFLRHALCAVQSSCTVLFRCARPTHALHAPSTYMSSSGVCISYNMFRRDVVDL